MPPTAGRVIAGRYFLEEPIGQGAMGVVWRAHDQVLNRKVAVKEVLLDAAIGEFEMPDGYQRTKREAQTAARLSHPNIVTVHDVAEEDGRPWIVMELVPSLPLDKVVASQGPLTPLRAARIGQQLLAAITAAHAAGVLHRDVKPSNVLITADRPGDDHDERAVLTDFGIAQFQDDPRLTQTGQLIGTVTFMAPERILGDDATPASDLWSLGATLYAAVEGHGPFDRNTTLATMSAIVHENPPPAYAAGRLAPLIAGLLRREPDDRLSAQAAARTFAEILPLMAIEEAAPRRVDTAPSVLPAPVAPQKPLSTPTQSFPPLAPQRPKPRRRSRKLGLISACIAGAAVLATGGFLLSNHGPGPETARSASATTTPQPEPASGANVPAVVSAIDDSNMTPPADFSSKNFFSAAMHTKAGFFVAWPDGWQAEKTGQEVHLCAPGTGCVTHVEIDLTGHVKGGMVAEAEYLAAQDGAEYPGHRPVYGRSKKLIQAETVQSSPGAFWQFDYTKGGTSMRMDVLLFNEDSQSYTIYMTAPAGTHDTDWDNLALPTVEKILRTFGPLGA